MHSIRCEQPYCCFDDFTEYKMARSDSMLDMHALCVILLEILVGTDIILSCGCWDNVDDLITVCEDYIDVDTAKLLHDLCKHSSDEYLKYYLDYILRDKPEIIGENIRAMDFAVKENRVLIEKKDSVMKVLLRQPALAKERWGLDVEQIQRYEPDFEGAVELFSEVDSDQIHEYDGKLIDSTIFNPLQVQESYTSRGSEFRHLKYLNFMFDYRG